MCPTRGSARRCAAPRRYVDFETGRRYTTADPRDDHRVLRAFGLALGFHGTGFLWVRYWLARRSPTSVRAYPRRLGVPWVGALCLAVSGALAPWPTDGPGEAFRFAGLCVLVVLVACAVAALVLRRRQSGDDTIAVTPSVPTAERCFPGMVPGEVPYAGTGGHPVVGPACPASTPDPTGAAFRREAPRTLTPVRVRPPYTADHPDRPDHDGRAQVLECEDGGVPVLVVTRGKNMPWVLGALRSARSADPSRR